MSRYTDEELAGLTDEEREALLEGEDEQEADEDLENEGLDEEGAGDSGSADDAGRDDDPEDGVSDTRNEGESEGNESADYRAPLLSADVPEDVEERIRKIGEEKEALIAKFDDGELTAREYQQELDRLAKQEREIEQAQFKAQLAREMEEQQARNAWLQTVKAFLDEHPEYREKQRLYKMLDMEVRELAAKEENYGLSGREILNKAHEQIAAELGLTTKADVRSEPKPNGRRKPINAPPTLAKVPAASATETEDGRWSKLDRLMETDPERYELELSRLSDADRESYLASQ